MNNTILDTILQLEEVIQVMHDIITDHIVASFIQYTSIPITNPIIKENWNVKN